MTHTYTCIYIYIVYMHSQVPLFDDEGDDGDVSDGEGAGGGAKGRRKPELCYAMLYCNTI